MSVSDVIEVRELPPRLIWQYQDVDWEVIESNITFFDWSVVREGTNDVALAVLIECLDIQMQSHVPSKIQEVRKCTLSWLNVKCYEAVRLKHEAESSDTYIHPDCS